MGDLDVQISLRPLEVISVNNGDVLKALNKSDDTYKGFGEVYFSEIKHGRIKAWKKHTKMVMNIVVPVGKVKFVFFEKITGHFKEVIIGRDNYALLTVRPNIWFGFQGLSAGKNIVMNISNIVHDPKESISLDQKKINYDWGIK